MRSGLQGAYEEAAKAAKDAEAYTDVFYIMPPGQPAENVNKATGRGGRPQDRL